MPLLMAALALVFAASKGLAQDPVKLYPDRYKVLFENEKVRVLELRDKPGDKSVMHSHPSYVVYVFKDFKRRFFRPDGKSKDLEGKAGTAMWSEAVTHAEENIDTTETHVLLIELKPMGKGSKR